MKRMILLIEGEIAFICFEQIQGLIYIGEHETDGRAWDALKIILKGGKTYETYGNFANEQQKMVNDKMRAFNLTVLRKWN